MLLERVSGDHWGERYTGLKGASGSGRLGADPPPDRIGSGRIGSNFLPDPTGSGQLSFIVMFFWYRSNTIDHKFLDIYRPNLIRKPYC